MKKNDFLIVLGAIGFTTLFYKQNPGVNYILFSSMLIGLLSAFNPQKLKDKHWWYYVLMVIITSTAVLITNSALSIFAGIVSMLMLCGKTIHKENSVVLSFAYTVYSVFSSFIYWIIDMSNVSYISDKGVKRKYIKLFLSVSISFIFALVFFFLYRASNPLFDELTKQINFDWLNFEGILFTLLGFLILYGLIKVRDIRLLSEYDKNFLKDITTSQNAEEENDLKYKSIIAFSLFIILNVMLLMINILDINQIFINQTLPQGITLSSFVHQAVWSIVFSIVVASVLIMWFFKDELNFNTFGKKVKILVYAWILQSILMIISAMIRNYWYIQEYQLTYLRIGVFTFLILSIIGLIHTYLKVSKRRSAWRLISNNFETWFLILAISSCFNWDRFITHYNIRHASESKPLDTEYLIELSDANIPDLIELYHLKDSTLHIKSRWQTDPLHYKLFIAHELLKTQSWQSFNFRDLENSRALSTIKFERNEK